MLSGCDVVDGLSAERVLGAMSDFNDRAQAWLFNPNTLAREYPARMITRPFPFNSFYTPNSPDLAPRIDPREFVLNVTGLVERKDDWTLRQLYALPRFTQITRHVCIEGWSAIGKWTGVRFSDFLARVGADRHAKYAGFSYCGNRWPQTPRWSSERGAGHVQPAVEGGAELYHQP